MSTPDKTQKIEAPADTLPGDQPEPMPFQKPESDLESSKDFRYECANKIEKNIRARKEYQNFRLQVIHVSTILLVPRECLEDGGYLSPNRRARDLHDNLKHVAGLVRHFFLKHNENVSELNNIDQAERIACRHRDHFRCIFTGISGGQVTQLVPFSWTKDKVNMYETDLVIGGLEAFFDDAIFNELESLLVTTSEPGNLIKQWNMINISKKLRAYHFCAFFGLKCLGIEPKKSQSKTHDSTEKATTDPETAKWEVNIQFHWLHRRCGKPTDEMTTMTDDTGMKDMIETQIQYEKQGCPPLTHPCGWQIGAVRSDNSPVISGHTFTLTMSQEDARKCQMMLDLQWFMMSIGAMSGAAGYPELLPPPLDMGKFYRQQNLEYEAYRKSRY